MPKTWEEVWNVGLWLIGYLGGFAVILAALAGFAYLMFRLFAERWIAAKFDRQLESHRHAQSRELEELRFKIQGMLDRTVKLQQKEFEVLPMAWDLMVEAYGQAQTFTSPLQTYPDVNRMNEEQLTEFLGESPLLNWQKEELRRSSDCLKYYQSAIFWHQLQVADGAVRKFNNYFWKNRIFMPTALQENFSALHKLMSDAIFERQMNEEMKDVKPEREMQKKMRTEGEDLRKTLESSIHSRLWN